MDGPRWAVHTLRRAGPASASEGPALASCRTLPIIGIGFMSWPLSLGLWGHNPSADLTETDPVAVALAPASDGQRIAVFEPFARLAVW